MKNILGEMGSGRNSGADDEFNFDNKVSREQRDEEAQRLADKLAAKLEELRARNVASAVPSQHERRNKKGKDSRIPIASSFRAKQAGKPHPITESGEKTADTKPEIKESEQAEADKAKLQEIVGQFVFIGRLVLEPSISKPDKYMFELFDTRGVEARSVLKQKIKTIDEIALTLQNHMKHNYKNKTK